MARKRAKRPGKKRQSVWLRYVTFGGAIGLGGLMWAYSLAQMAGLHVSGGGFGVSRLVSLVGHWT